MLVCSNVNFLIFFECALDVMWPLEIDPEGGGYYKKLEGDKVRCATCYPHFSIKEGQLNVAENQIWWIAE